MPGFYDKVRATIAEDGVDTRVEVNQRALIDKILARYASAGAVYRELLQNSNDAEATKAEIHFTTDDKGVVKQVLYRNNGLPFGDDDWARLKSIAEGNPSPEKIGAFGVGAYTMFSICEEPLVVSGSKALAFLWKGDQLWTKTAENKAPTEWTDFHLPSRDPYPLPDMVEFGEFLTASLTFTRCLKYVCVLVNDKERLSIIKTLVAEPRPVSTPKVTSWFQSTSASTSTPRGTFSLSKSSSTIVESVHRLTVSLDGSVSSLDARYVSASATTKIPADMARRMERVTKKSPPKTVSIDLFLNAQRLQGKPKTPADTITESFSPRPGAGRIFIGFRTSQTTGLAAHVAAPFVPTVEREAMDLQDPTLRVFNAELLTMAGILLRLTLEDTMYSVIDPAYRATAEERDRREKELLRKDAEPRVQEPSQAVEAEQEEDVDSTTTISKSGIMGFARFMAK